MTKAGIMALAEHRKGEYPGAYSKRLEDLAESNEKLVEALKKCTDHSWGTADLDALAEHKDRMEKLASQGEPK